MPTVIDSLLVTLGLDNRDFIRSTEQSERAIEELRDTVRETEGTIREETDRTGRTERQRAEERAQRVRGQRDLDRRRADETVRASRAEQDNVKRATDGYRRFAGELAGVVALLTGVQNIQQGMRNFATNESALGRLASNLGITPETLSLWESAGQKVGGTAQGIDQTFRSLSGLAARVHIGAQSSDENLWMSIFGVTPDDLENVPQALEKIHNAIQGMDPRRVTMGFQALGIDEGTGNLLRAGNMDALLEQARKLGTVTGADTKAAQTLQTALADLSQASSIAGVRALTELTPGLVAFLKALTGLAKLAQDHPDISAGILTALGLGTAFEAASLIARITGLATAFSLLAAAEKEIIAAEASSVAVATGGGLLGTFFRFLGPLAAFLAVMSPSPTNGGPGSGGESAERQEMRRRGLLPGGGGGGAAGDRTAQAMDYFIGQGRNPAEAAGIVGNLQQESGLNPRSDNGSHYGIAQWDASRRAEIERHFGKSLADMSFEEQLAAVEWELRHGSDSGAQKTNAALQGLQTPDTLDPEKTAQTAAMIVNHGYERPANPGTPEMAAEDAKRAANAVAAMRAWQRHKRTARAASVPHPDHSWMPSPSDLILSPRGGDTNTSSTSTHIGELHIHTQASDSASIVREIPGAIRRQFDTYDSNFGLS